MISRRLFLGGAAALPLLPGRAFAGAALTLGGMQVDTLSDGNLMLPREFSFPGLPEAELAEILARHGADQDMFEPPCNLTLARDGTNTVLFDVGSGADFMPSAGKIGEALDAMGVGFDEITHVVFTHGHPDHLWGLIDEFDEPIFAQAQYMMGRAEFEYWMDPNTVSTIGEARASFAVGAARRLELIADQIVLFEDGQEILPGIAARAAPGHTPGHMAFELRSGSESVMVVGDAIGNPHVAFERPDWHSGSDHEPGQGAATRTGLLGQLADAQMPLVGFHLPGGGLGRVERAGGAFRFVPGA